MSTYQELRGLKVKYLAANPDPGTAGDVWYNSTSFALKAFVGRAAWSSGAAYVNAAAQDAAAAGTQTAALGAGGYTTGHVATSGEYDGTGWVSGEDMPGNMSSHGGIGTQTAALMFGGAVSPQAQSLEYDGTDWTAGGDVNTVRYKAGVVGTQTAGLKFAGGNPGFVGPTESYDGSPTLHQQLTVC